MCWNPYHVLGGAPLAGDPLEVGPDVGGVELHHLPRRREANRDLPVRPVSACKGDAEPPRPVSARVHGGVLPGARRRRRRWSRPDLRRGDGLRERAAGGPRHGESVVLDRVAAEVGFVAGDDGGKVGPAVGSLVREHLHRLADGDHLRGFRRNRRPCRRRLAAESRRPHWGFGGGGVAGWVV